VKKRALYAAAGLLAFAPPFHAHDIITTNLTFSRDVSRIFKQLIHVKVRLLREQLAGKE
jgi:hypothetical protein